jgi:hypothetical protein
MAKAKRKTDTRGPLQKIEAPTPEQVGAFAPVDITDKAANGRTICIGKAFRRVVMIDLLLKQEILDTAQHKALKHYRHHADVADRSPLKDSLNKAPGGGTGIPSIEVLNAVRVAADCERAAGSLRDILRAVVVDDVSLSQWAMMRGGARQEGARIKPHKKQLAIAQLEIKMAAVRVRNELDGGR